MLSRSARVSSLLIPLVLMAAFADKQPSKPDIPALIKQLGADTYAEREEASAALEKIGGPACEPLRLALKGSDLEVRRRAERILERIEKKIFGERRRFEGLSGSVNGVAFSPDGKRAATADHRSVRLWDLESGKLLAKTEEHDDRVMAVCFSPDGKKIASASEDRTVRVQDATTLAEQRVFRGHKGDVRAVAFTRDGKHLVSGGRDQTLRVWDVQTGKAGKVIAVGHAVVSAAISPDGKQVLVGTLGSDAALRFDLPTGKAQPGLAGHTSRVMSVCFSRDGKRALTGSQDGSLRLWNMTTLQSIEVLKGDGTSITCVAISADGKRAVSGGVNKKLSLWDLNAGLLIRDLPGHTDALWSVAFAPDGKRALSSSQDGTVRLWSVGY